MGLRTLYAAPLGGLLAVSLVRGEPAESEACAMPSAANALGDGAVGVSRRAH